MLSLFFYLLIIYLVFDTRINIIIVYCYHCEFSINVFCDDPPVPVNEKLHYQFGLHWIQDQIDYNYCHCCLRLEVDTAATATIADKYQHIFNNNYKLWVQNIKYLQLVKKLEITIRSVIVHPLIYSNVM